MTELTNSDEALLRHMALIIIDQPPWSLTVDGVRELLRPRVAALVEQAAERGAAAERARLAGLLRTARKRQAVEWEDDPAHRVDRAYYLLALEQAAILVGSGGVEGVLEEVRGPQ